MTQKKHRMSLSRTGPKLALLAVCLLAFALRLHLLEDIFLNEDEEKSLRLYVQQPVDHIWAHYDPNNHWLMSGLGHGLGQWGQQRFWLRWPSVLFGVLAVPLTALAGGRLLGSRSYGLLAAFWLAVSAFHLHWSQQFRGYSALLFFALLSLLLLYQALRTGRQAYWWGFLGSMAFTLVSHLYGVLVLIVALAVMASWLWPHQRTRGKYLRQNRWAWTVCSLAPVLVAYLIWFGQVYVINFYHASPKATWTQQIYYQWLALGPTIPEIIDFLKGLALAFTTHPNERMAVVLFSGLGLAGLAVASARLPRAALFLGLWLLGPLIVVSLAEFAVAGFFVFSRFLIFVLPAWLLLAAVSLTAGIRWLAARLAPAGQSRTLVFVGLLLSCLAYTSLLNLKAVQAYFGVQASNDWRSVAAYLASRVGPQDLIICDRLLRRTPPASPGDNSCVLELRRRLAALVTPAPAAQIVAADELEPFFRRRSPKTGAVWVVIWGVNGPLSSPTALTFDRLGYTTLFKIESKRTLGAALNQAVTQLTSLDAPLAFPARKFTANFGQPPNIRLLGHTLPATFQAGQTIPITTLWQTLAPVSEDYTIFLHLRNSANQTVAQLDFRPFDGAYPTSHWLPGSTIEETRLWILPADVPPGPYSLRLGLYQVQTLARLPLLEDTDGENAVTLSQVWLE
jgi:4-amino-4-deoxy-L-arabinose transferase-like glycosyltransferase